MGIGRVDYERARRFAGRVVDHLAAELWRQFPRLSGLGSIIRWEGRIAASAGWRASSVWRYLHRRPVGIVGGQAGARGKRAIIGRTHIAWRTDGLPISVAISAAGRWGQSSLLVGAAAIWRGAGRRQGFALNAGRRSAIRIGRVRRPAVRTRRRVWRDILIVVRRDRRRLAIRRRNRRIGAGGVVLREGFSPQSRKAQN